MIGMCFEYVTCEATKLAVGRLRPHFIDVCKPNIGYLTCNNPYVYITNYTCTSSFSEYLKKEAHVSFYSGHTATTMHVVAYCVVSLYLLASKLTFNYITSLYFVLSQNFKFLAHQIFCCTLELFCFLTVL